MEKIKFAVQVLLLMTVIPALFIGTILGNDARINASKKHAYSKRIIISCGMSKIYVKK